MRQTQISEDEERRYLEGIPASNDRLFSGVRRRRVRGAVLGEPDPLGAQRSVFPCLEVDDSTAVARREMKPSSSARVG